MSVADGPVSAGASSPFGGPGPGRTDLHCHILPGVDDGAASLEQAVAMARSAWADGTTAILATPHAGLPGKSSSRDAIGAAYAALRQELARAGVAVEVQLAAEVLFAPDLPNQLQQDPALTIAGAGKYVLTELPLYSYPTYVADVCFQLLLAGIVPILAHPERNIGLQQHPRRLYELVSQGVMAQVDAESLTGRFGPEAEAAALVFLRCGLVHFLGSDAHGVQHRPPLLAAAAQRMEQEVGAERAQQITVEWPRQVLAGVYVDPGEASLPHHGEGSRQHAHRHHSFLRSLLSWRRA